MAEDGRRRHFIEPVDEVQVTVADTTGHHVHENFMLEGRVDFDLFDGQRLMGSMEDGGLHVRFPERWRWPWYVATVPDRAAVGSFFQAQSLVRSANSACHINPRTLQRHRPYPPACRLSKA